MSAVTNLERMMALKQLKDSKLKELSMSYRDKMLPPDRLKQILLGVSHLLSNTLPVLAVSSIFSKSRFQYSFLSKTCESKVISAFFLSSFFIKYSIHIIQSLLL